MATEKVSVAPSQVYDTDEAQLASVRSLASTCRKGSDLCEHYGDQGDAASGHVLVYFTVCESGEAYCLEWYDWRGQKVY